tara:strand:- start:101 stop:484 length:384 start_codon:yes stop_codon:yes gene_type:complete
MVQLSIKNIIKEVYPLIAKDYKSNAKVEVYTNIFDRLNSTPAILEYESYAEYSWSHNKIYLYTDHLESEEDIIRSLIHECVHSNQCYDIYEALYECNLDYDTHPYEIEAEYEEEKWKKYKLNTMCIG